MKKLLFILLSVVILLTGCGNPAERGNHDSHNTVWTYDTAITRWPDGTMKIIKIKRWCCYGESIHIIGEDNVAYLLSSCNTILIQLK